MATQGADLKEKRLNVKDLRFCIAPIDAGVDRPVLHLVIEVCPRNGGLHHRPRRLLHRFDSDAGLMFVFMPEEIHAVASKRNVGVHPVRPAARPARIRRRQSRRRMRLRQHLPRSHCPIGVWPPPPSRTPRVPARRSAGRRRKGRRAFLVTALVSASKTVKVTTIKMSVILFQTSQEIEIHYAAGGNTNRDNRTR